MIGALLVAAAALAQVQDQDPQAAFAREVFDRLRRVGEADELLRAAPWRGEALVFDYLHTSLTPGEEARGVALARSLADALERVDRPLAAEDVARRAGWSGEALACARDQREAWLAALDAAGAGRLRAAEALAEEAARMAVELGATAVEARARRTLGRVLSDLGECDRGRAELERALAVQRARDARVEVARDLVYLADLEERCGRFADALRLRQEALELAGRVGEPTAPLELGIGRLAMDLGRYELARTSFVRAERSTSRAERAEARFALAALESALGRYAAGLRVLEAVAASAREQEDPHLRARAESTRAALLSELGRYREAELALDAAAAALPADAPGWESARLDLARALIGVDEGRPGEVLPLLEDLVARFESHGVPAAADEARQQRARALSGLERDDEAARAWREVAQRHVARGRRGPAALALAGLGDAERALGRRGPAEEAYARAIAFADELASAEVGWRARGGLAGLRESESDWTGAYELLNRAAEQLEVVRFHLEAPSLRLRFLDDKLDLYRRATRAAARVGRVEEAFRWTECAKARVLSEVYDDAAELEGPRARVTLLELAFSRPVGDAAPTRHRDALADELVRARDEVEAARIRAELTRPTRAAWSGLATPPSLTALRAALPEDTALVEYLLNDDFALAWVVTSRGARLVDLPVSGARIRNDARRMVAAVEAMRSGAADLANLPFDVAAGRALHRVLVEPLAADLRGARRVLLVPDEGLWGLPFAALVVAHERRSFDPSRAYGHLAGCRFWIEDVELVVLPSASSVLDARRTPWPEGEDGPVVLVGDPATSPRGASALPGARRELAAAREALAPRAVTILRGADATEARLREVAAGARWLHLATHGEYDVDRPSASRVALTPGDGMDGWLHAFEVEELDLRAELVVLSACETAGAHAPGEGILGLPRAFRLAGARDVIATLWVVDDRASERVAGILFRELGHGRRPSAALRGAQLALLAESRAGACVDLHPFFWSGYVCFGTH